MCGGGRTLRGGRSERSGGPGTGGSSGRRWAADPRTFTRKRSSVSMLLPGYWRVCDNGVLRPVFRGRIVSAGGFSLWSSSLWTPEPIGRCCPPPSLISSDCQAFRPTTTLGGVGGVSATVLVATAIHLPRAGGGDAVFRGQFAAFTAPEALDMSVLGRDVTNLFTLIVDRPRDVVCLLGAGINTRSRRFPRRFPPDGLGSREG